MAFSEALAERIRQGLARLKGVEEKKMFGGVGFLLNGNMLVGVWKNSLIVRLGPDSYDDALLEPHVKEFNITGRPMKGWVLVEPGRCHWRRPVGGLDSTSREIRREAAGEVTAGLSCMGQG